MTSALVLFRQPYARDLVAELFPSLDWLDVLGIASSASELDVMLDNGAIDVLLIGPTFIEAVEFVLRRRRILERPLVVVLTRSDLASDKVRAAHHHIDKVISMSRGMGAMLDDLKKCVTSPATCQCDSAEVSELDSMTTSAIYVTDAADREIVRLVAAGFADREIAEIVNYSHQTIRNRISRILGDTGARNRTHLACMYLNLIHEGIIPFVAA